MRRLVLGLARDAPLQSVRVDARLHAGTPWQDITGPHAAGELAVGDAGWQVPLAWPPAWVKRAEIAEQLRITLTFAPGIEAARLDRIVLLPDGVHARGATAPARPALH